MSKANNAQAELVGRLRAFADIEDGGGTCDLQMAISPSREAAAEIERMAGEIEALRTALEGIRDFGFRHPGHGHSCATLARRALGGGEK